MRPLLAAALLFTAVPAAATPAPAFADFGWFADLAGACWIGTFPDGKTEHEHCYTTQFDRFVRGTATLRGDKDGTKHDLFAGDSLFAWDAASARIVYYIWGSDGSHGRHEAHYVGALRDSADLAFPIESRKEPGRIAYRSLWHRIDADTFEVHKEVPDGDGWKTELTVRYTRKAAP